MHEKTERLRENLVNFLGFFMIKTLDFFVELCYHNTVNLRISATDGKREVFGGC